MIILSVYVFVDGNRTATTYTRRRSDHRVFRISPGSDRRDSIVRLFGGCQNRFGVETTTGDDIGSFIGYRPHGRRASVTRVSVSTSRKRRETMSFERRRDP